MAGDPRKSVSDQFDAVSLSVSQSEATGAGGSPQQVLRRAVSPSEWRAVNSPVWQQAGAFCAPACPNRNGYRRLLLAGRVFARVVLADDVAFCVPLALSNSTYVHSAA